MKYRESQLDKRLRRWFENDYSHAHIRKIDFVKGAIRGLTDVKIEFNYPIVALAGKNGSGKSTILALTCCAFHNTSRGFRLPSRKNTYYTFADFFIQHKEEVPPEGIAITYHIAYDRWKPTARFPDGKGIGLQSRHKKKGGKWNDYADRVRRDVLFLGIERIVPHNEKSQFKSYRNAFRDATKQGWEDSVKNIVGYILKKKYDGFRYVSYSKYRLPIVESSGAVYSGFNMGAGENALFEIFANIYSCSEGSLIVVDEIELGLHVEAQKRLIEKLKDVCLERKIQVVCTTHSRHIFECLPPDARLFLESVGGKSRVTGSISPDHAFAKMSAENSREIDVLVEDVVSKALIAAVLPSELRVRVNIEVIGSATALVKQLVALYRRKSQRTTLVVFDGDQRDKEKDNISTFKSLSEQVGDGYESWFLEHVSYMPGETWPERWVVTKAIGEPERIALLFNADSDEIKSILTQAISANRHAEFYEMGRLVNLAEEEVLTRLAIFSSQCSVSDFSEIFEVIDRMLH